MQKLFTVVAQILAVGVMMALTGSAGAQQPYPNKAIRMLIPYASGGSTTTVARLLGQKLTESWGQPVIVDNRPGGNSVIGTDAAAKSPPDGYTILFMGGGLVITPLVVPTPYDAFKDFAPVASVGKTEYVLAINPSVPANNLQELIALARSRPGQINYASAGSGTPPHLAGELLKIADGISIQHIPYKGGVPAVADVIGGQVELTMQPTVFFIAHIRSLII